MTDALVRIMDENGVAQDAILRHCLFSEGMPASVRRPCRTEGEITNDLFVQASTFRQKLGVNR